MEYALVFQFGRRESARRFQLPAQVVMTCDALINGEIVREKWAHDLQKNEQFAVPSAASFAVLRDGEYVIPEQ